jgi:NAD(P)H-quinone oxidoreductase subunit 5
MLEYDLKLILGTIVVAAPALLVFALGVPTLLKWKLAEPTINWLVRVSIVTGLLASTAILGLMLIDDTRHVVIAVGDWAEIPHYHFSIMFVFDRLSVPMAILSFVLTGTIGGFAARYMHRESGYNRFFVLYAFFVLGMTITSLANTIETLFAGWELVGLSSALLVAYYQERTGPAQNGVWMWTVYRVSDAALLLAAVVLHHMAGEGDFDRLLGAGPWPDGNSTLSSTQALVVGLLFLVAAAGKSGLVPFSGWLPRAMEGPTPSSAIFYGALSVHLGAFLLLRVSPILDGSLVLCAVIVALGLTTAVLAYIVGSVQTDIKSALSYACLSQVGLIVAEIGLGFRYIALIHLLGNACLRTLQFVRAPNLLMEHRSLENAIGGRLPRPAGPVDRFVAARFHSWLYRFALERAYLDIFLADFVVVPFLRVFRWCDSKEQAWTDFLSAGEAYKPEKAQPYSAHIEELL